jgi:cyclic pyranopterin phosphate synthase
MSKTAFSHLTPRGVVKMVDVGEKTATRRVAIAEAVVEMAPATLELLKKSALPKGNVLACAQIGGIMAAKRVSDLIPLCHPVALNFVDISFAEREIPPQIHIRAEVRADNVTGVEMEAIVAAQTAAAIIYDMCKAVQRDIVITRVRLLHKSGGSKGEFNALEWQE